MRPVPTLPLALLLATLGSACSGESTGPAVDLLDELPRALTASEQEVISASNRFGFDLLGEVAARDDRANVVLSPLSASMALGMTLNGAAGTTFDAMRATLGYPPMSVSEINASYASLLDLLLELDEGVDFSIGNAIWARADVPFHDAFFEAVTAAFDARVESADFSDPATLDAINDWASQATEGYIPKVLESLDADLVMLLVNAIFFDGQWTTRFDPDETAPADFRRADGSTVTVDLMSMTDATVPAAFGEGYTAVELTYGRGAFGMVLVLPDPTGSARELAAEMDVSRWNGLVGALTEQELARVALPRFETSYDALLNPALEAMGMGVAFGSDADFSNLSPIGDGLCIDFVRQKTFIEVDEAGTRAAAVTSVGIGPTSLPPSFVADRPFLFAIRERLSGTVLFTGVVGDPTVTDSGPDDGEGGCH